mmetsp:Transcript_76791/g.150581  ORF Transcript_76791/g.150581 Transcript_76791/m.150581 type:complete len:195 (+) Transcript_76791:68-652(+)|eukprot:CAMPEP_0170345628 /NCGR_PEP_ID=MMETSP0116_2-20130129/74045_1 /TAXON_ID=400756 /ORGANISM="Durinskia baltica, Strain CSIRO CS-38" /LENGTH=194 /DNA_ID=CAMNT_0010599393 /DNA_START=63 /DNA_END=647 /DNA_ORIENTATION=-
MGANAARCSLDETDLNACKAWRGDGAVETIGEDDLDGDVKNSQALTNHKLLKAARDGLPDEVQRCLDNGAFIETRRPFVMTPESVATPGSTLQTRGIGLTPLMYAAQGGYPEACEVLLSNGACANAEDEDGMRPLHFAATSGSEEACRVLIAKGAEVAARDDDGRTALDCVPPMLTATAAEKRQWAAILETKDA